MPSRSILYMAREHRISGRASEIGMARELGFGMLGWAVGSAVAVATAVWLPLPSVVSFFVGFALSVAGFWTGIGYAYRRGAA